MLGRISFTRPAGLAKREIREQMRATRRTHDTLEGYCQLHVIGRQEEPSAAQLRNSADIGYRTPLQKSASPQYPIDDTLQ
jgi:hypothetical protein